MRTTVTRGKRVAEHLQRPVARRVVDDDDLDRDGLRFDARESLGEQIAGVQRRDDDDCPHATRQDTRMRRVVMWSTDPVGKQMAGPGIRYHRLATRARKALRGDARCSRRTDSWDAVHLPSGRVRGLRVGRGGRRRRRPEPATRPDPSLHRAGVRIVFDLYAPALVEAAAILAGEEAPIARKGASATKRSSRSRGLPLLGDAFLCASERQRDHWLGALAALGRVSPEVYGRDPALRSLVAVVPFGLDPAAIQSWGRS